MSGFIGFIGIAGLAGSLILAIMDPRSAITYITTGIASCVVCFLIVHILGIMYDIRDTLHEINSNTKKEEPKSSVTAPSRPTFATKVSTGWTCKACGQLNATTASFCKSCGKDR